MELINFMIEASDHAAHNTLIQLILIAVVWDTTFGVIRAISEKKFNSNFGIDGAKRKVGIVISLVFLVLVDEIVQFNLIGFVPKDIRVFMGLETVGMTEFFALLFLAYEVVSILKNMALCGLPVKGVWIKVRAVLGKYTDELPALPEDNNEK